MLIVPAEDDLENEPKCSWVLPHPDILGSPYEVYECEIAISDSISGAQDWSVFFCCSESEMRFD